MIKDSMRAVSLMVGGLTKRRAWDGPLSGAALKVSQALRRTRYPTALDTVRLCPDLARRTRY